ncbi:MAG: transglutaminase-like cysteine peptidase, partial [bacterium]
QNGFAITEGEYEQLRIMWNDFSEQTKVRFLESPEGQWLKNFFVIILLYDLNNNIDWAGHVKNLTNLGAAGFSLTISLFNQPVTLKTARKTLVDLLYKGKNMFCDGQLTITDKIKTAAAKRSSRRARERLVRWERLINSYQQRSIWNQLAAVNNFFNQEISADRDGSSKRYDYWQSPIETLVRGCGDCDDFAIGKYVSLRLLGVPAKQLRIALLTNRNDGGHAVLFFYPKSLKYPMVLDQIDYTQSRYNKNHILPLSLWRSFSNMKPIFEINEECVTVFGPGQKKNVTHYDPYEQFPRFGAALFNSRRLLPQSEGKVMKQNHKPFLVSQIVLNQ